MLVQEYALKLDCNTFKNYLEICKTYDVIQELETVTSPEAVYLFMTNYVRIHEMAEEEVYVIALNSKSRILGLFMLSHGTVNCSLVSPRELFYRALLIGAVNVILVHNHPSLDTNPSNEDKNSTKRLKDAGELLGVKLLDHIIIGDGFYSFKTNNLL